MLDFQIDSLGLRKQVRMIEQATKNILLVDDHPIFLDAISAAISDRFPSASVTRATSAHDVRQRLKAGCNPTLAVVDINLPDADGVDLIRDLHATYNIPIIAFSGQSDSATINACIKSGAIGYVPKSYDTERLYAAMDAVISGGQHFPPSFLKGRVSNGIDQITLTRRQRTVLELVLQAMPTKTIADELNIAEGTVKNHISDLLSIFAVTSRNELLVKARQLRVLQ
jgi:DNA-binding NarL/FixJ family response regulator